MSVLVEIVKTENSETQTDILKFNEYIQSIANGRLKIATELNEAILHKASSKSKLAEARKECEKNQQNQLQSSCTNNSNDDVILISNKYVPNLPRIKMNKFS
jgi:hypothetical protein